MACSWTWQVKKDHKTQSAATILAGGGQLAGIGKCESNARKECRGTFARSASFGWPAVFEGNVGPLQHAGRAKEAAPIDAKGAAGFSAAYKAAFARL